MTTFRRFTAAMLIVAATALTVTAAGPTGIVNKPCTWPFPWPPTFPPIKFPPIGGPVTPTTGTPAKGTPAKTAPKASTQKAVKGKN